MTKLEKVEIVQAFLNRQVTLWKKDINKKSDKITMLLAVDEGNESGEKDN